MTREIPDLMESEILIVTALGWEARQVLRHVSAREPSRDGSAVLWRATAGERRVAVLKTGVGPNLATRAIRWAGDIVRPASVIVTGCAGALASTCDVGSVVVATEVIDGRDRRSWPTSAAWCERYLRAARAASLDVRAGKLFTSTTILESATSKSTLATELGADAVEMEAAPIAAWAASANIDFGAARVIVDDAQTIMPLEIAAITGPDGAPNVRKLIAAIANRRALARELAALGTATFKCKRALSALHRQLFRDLIGR